MRKFLLTSIGVAAWIAVALLMAQGDATAAYLFISIFLWIGVALYGLKITFDRHHENGVELVMMLLLKTVIFISGFMLSATLLGKPLGILFGILCLLLTTLAIHFFGAKTRTTVKELLINIDLADEQVPESMGQVRQRPESVVKADLCGYFVATVLSIASIGEKVERGDVLAELRAEPRFGGKDVNVKVFAEHGGVVSSVNFKVGDKIWDEIEIMRVEIR